LKKLCRRIVLAVLLAALAWSLSSALTTIMPLDQVKAGQKGKGRTVFEANKVEEFDVDILGILYNYQPKRNVILARLRGKNLETTGVVAGMSGSPVYVDGKLIGAVAFSFPYAKEAIAGITPIGEMLAISPEKTKSSSFPSASVSLPLSLRMEDVFEIWEKGFSEQQDFIAGGQACRFLKIPLLLSGFSSNAVEKARPFLTRMGFYPVLSGQTGQVTEKLLMPEPALKEGDPVAVQLISGDMDMSALGTVTYVDGNKILAFGHPLYNMGPVDYAMTTAKVITIVPALDNSFKLAATGNLIGAFTQDRVSGALGEIGKTPRMIPINVRLIGDSLDLKEFKFQVINDRILSPLLANLSLVSLLGSEGRSNGDLSLELDGDIYLDNKQSVHLEDLYSGNFGASTQDLSGILTAVIYLLINNEFKDVGIFRIDLNIRASEEPKFAYLERVWLDKYEVSPGEAIDIKVFFRSFRGESVEEEVGVLAPHLPAGSEFQLIVGDAASMHQVEVSQYRTTGFVPRNLNQLIRILNNLRKNSRIYFKVIASKPGLFLKGEEMPNLPPTMKFMFTSPRAAASLPTELSISTLMEYQLPLPFIFKGMAVIPIKIRN
jgi:hypothetical protein